MKQEATLLTMQNRVERIIFPIRVFLIFSPTTSTHPPAKSKLTVENPGARRHALFRNSVKRFLTISKNSLPTQVNYFTQAVIDCSFLCARS